ncbi:hypothetical protein BDZ89DRAFT_1056863 [Hymenopellis radicata]|nr:hypothetical protein BDZ89DRAFT_1056863 [Hymenopellis radicata]
MNRLSADLLHLCSLSLSIRCDLTAWNFYDSGFGTLGHLYNFFLYYLTMTIPGGPVNASLTSPMRRT